MGLPIQKARFEAWTDCRCIGLPERAAVIVKNEGSVVCRDLTGEAEAREEIEARRRAALDGFMAAGPVFEKNIAIGLE